LRLAPLRGETTWSLLCRLSARYGLEPHNLLGHWQWRDQQPRHRDGRRRADAEVLLDRTGRGLLAALCGVEDAVLGRALPSWAHGDAMPTAGAGSPDRPQGQWRTTGTVAGPVAFGCRSCTAARTGEAVRVVRYAARWERVCTRHHRWALDADADHPLEYLDLRGCPQVLAAQRQWGGVARRARRSGVEPGEVFGLASAVVCRWWEESLHWEQEQIWSARLRQVAGAAARAGTGTTAGLGWWRAVVRDALVFPEVVTVASTLLEPAMAQLVWRDSGGERARPLPADGAFCHELGVRVHRPWLGPLVAVDHGGPLLSWMGSVIRHHRGTSSSAAGTAEDPWWVRPEHQPPTTAAQLRVLGKVKTAAGPVTSWHAAVPGPRRHLISGLVASAEEQLTQLRGAQRGTSGEAAQRLLQHLSYTAGLLDRALWESATAALEAGESLEDLACWARRPVEVLAAELAAYRGRDQE